jgi:hypothetical protein
MVNGTDAASIAAARECALGHGSVLARAAAVQILRENIPSATISTFTAPQCDPPLTSPGAKPVTVVANTGVDYFFAPIFGMSSGTVSARAVAVWGPASRAFPVPITVDKNQITGCGIPVNLPPPGGSVPCELTYPKDTLSEPRWGILDLSKWNDPTAAPCHVDASTLKNTIDSGGWSQPLPLNGEPPGTEPTYDCLDNGLSFSVWADMVGKTLTFPVIDVPTSLGAGCTGEDAGCQIDTANIVSFVTLKVLSAVNDGSTVVLQVEWLGPDTVPDVPIGSGLDYGLRTTRLVE